MIVLRMIFVLLLANWASLPQALSEERDRRALARHRKSRWARKQHSPRPRRHVSIVANQVSYGNGCWSYTLDDKPHFVYGHRVA